MKKRVIIYTDQVEQFKNLAWPDNYILMFGSPRFFENPLSSVDAYWAAHENIKKAYAKIEKPLVTLPGEKKVEAAPEVVVKEKIEDTPVETAPEASDPDEDESEEDESLDMPLDEDFSSTFAAPEASEEATHDLPEDWRGLSWPKLRALANQYSDDSVSNKADAIEILEAVEKG